MFIFLIPLPENQKNHGPLKRVSFTDQSKLDLVFIRSLESPLYFNAIELQP
jgi:hypothetical protein